MLNEDIKTGIYEVLHLVRRAILVFEASTVSSELPAVFMEISSQREVADCYSIHSDLYRRSSLFSWALNFPLVDNSTWLPIPCFGTVGPQKLSQLESFKHTLRNLYHLQKVLHTISFDYELSASLLRILLDGFVGRLSISNETSAALFPSGPSGCQFLYLPGGSSISETWSHLIVSLLKFLLSLPTCGQSLLSSFHPPDAIHSLSQHFNQTLINDDCTRNLARSMLADFWTRPDLPPTIDECLRASKEIITVPLPLVINIDNKSSLDSTSRVITINPFYGNTTLSLRIPTRCPSSANAMRQDCDELSISECGSYGGCFVLWGPCQTVSDGFYSPSGTLNQIPCPESIGPNEEYIPSSSQIFCQSSCYALFFRATNGTCIPVPIGFIVDPCNERNLISCGFEDTIGIIPMQSSTVCLGRPIGAGIGPPSVVQDIPPLSIETWLRLNTKLVTQDLVLFGIVGYLAIGIRNISTSDFAICFYGNQLTGREVVLSDPISHLDGSQWVHIAVVINAQITFYMNADIVGEMSVTPGPSVFYPSLIRDDLNPIILSLIGRLHYGPFVFLASDLLSSSPFPDFFIFDPSDVVSPEFQLFNPNVIDKELTQLSLGFFGVVPPGFPRPEGSVNMSAILADLPRKFSWLNCENFCYSNWTHCVHSCGPGIFNPDTCECEAIPTAQVSTETSTTISLSSRPVATSPTENNPLSESLDKTVLIIILVAIVAVTSLLSLWIIRKRRVVKVGQVKRRNSTMHHHDPFTDITAMYFSSN